MPDYDYELVVVVGGPAGEKGAAQAAYFGHKTIVIEAYRELGGACINWGTLASALGQLNKARKAAAKTCQAKVI